MVISNILGIKKLLILCIFKYFLDKKLLILTLG
nr:MAG TPA: hypothetical protein [Caudoviricetes sp.]